MGKLNTINDHWHSNGEGEGYQMSRIVPDIPGLSHNVRDVPGTNAMSRQDKAKAKG